MDDLSKQLMDFAFTARDLLGGEFEFEESREHSIILSIPQGTKFIPGDLFIRVWVEPYRSYQLFDSNILRFWALRVGFVPQDHQATLIELLARKTHNAGMGVLHSFVAPDDYLYFQSSCYVNVGYMLSSDSKDCATSTIYSMVEGIDRLYPEIDYLIQR